MFEKREKDTQDYQALFEKLNFLKVLAITGVILLHYAAGVKFTEPVFLLRALTDLGEMGVDIFILISGLQLSITNLQNASNGIRWTQWYTRRVIRIFPAYWISIICYILFFFFTSGSPTSIATIFLHLSGLQAFPFSNEFFGIYAAQWFITLIVVCYLLFPLFFRSFEKHYAKSLILVIALFVIYIVFFNTIQLWTYSVLGILNLDFVNYYVFLKQSLLWVPRLFSFNIGIALGFLLAKGRMTLPLKLTTRRSFIIFFSLTIFSFSLFMWIETQWFFIVTVVAWRSFLFTGFAFCLCIFLLQLCSRYPRVGRLLKFPASFSYEIYLLHGIPDSLAHSLFSQVLGPAISPLLWLGCIPLLLALDFAIAYPLHLFNMKLLSKQRLGILYIWIEFSLIGIALILLVI